MKTFATAVGLAAGASAGLLRRNDGGDKCCFQLTASGGASGSVGQLDDGQNRVGGDLGAATYCISSGSITDESGRGCILTAPTTQFQCDMGASPDGGFSIDNSGMLQHDGDGTIYACPADEGEYNLYTQKVDRQPKCVEVSLSTGGKCANGGAESMTKSYGMPTSYGSSTSKKEKPTSYSMTEQSCPPQQTVTKEITKTEQGKPETVYKTETVQKTEEKPTTVYKTRTIEETETATKATTEYQTKTIEKTETAEKPTTVYQTKTIQQTVTAETPTTIYKTKTEEETKTVPTTVYQTKTQQVTETAEKPTTVYQTKTIQHTVTAATPTTVYKTKTEEETEYQTKTVPTTIYQTKTAEQPTTVYQTSTVQQTITAEKPTTVYKTKVVEETQTATKPTTIYSTVQQTVTAQQPTTVYKTKVIEETETSKVQGPKETQYVTKTKEGKAATITKVVSEVQTKTEHYCPSSKPTQGKPTEGKPTATQTASACPTDLSGQYEYPHLIVPISSESPDKSYGTSYNGKMDDSTSSVFNFDIPNSYAGQICSLVFLFPEKSDLETSDYTFNGEGSISVGHLSSAASQDTTWNSCPKAADHMGSISPQPGNSYVISTGECMAGTTQSYELSAEGGLDLEYFQDYNPSPIGLYITTC